MVNFAGFFNDVDGDSLIYRFENLPEWLRWEVWNETITGVP